MEKKILYRIYRPISVLPCLSKILEKLIKMRLLSFFEKHRIFYQHQYGFCPKHSTSQAVLDITSSLYDHLSIITKRSLLNMIGFDHY